MNCMSSPLPPPLGKKLNKIDVTSFVYSRQFIFPQRCFGDKQEVASAKNRCKSCYLCICIHVVSIDADFSSNQFSFQHFKHLIKHFDSEKFENIRHFPDMDTKKKQKKKEKKKNVALKYNNDDQIGEYVFIIRLFIYPLLLQEQLYCVTFNLITYLTYYMEHENRLKKRR